MFKLTSHFDTIVIRAGQIIRPVDQYLLGLWDIDQFKILAQLGWCHFEAKYTVVLCLFCLW